MPRAAIILIFTSPGLTISARLDPPWILVEIRTERRRGVAFLAGEALVLPPPVPGRIALLDRCQPDCHHVQALLVWRSKGCDLRG